MTELSPAALAVWATYLDYSEMDETPADLPALAAAFRAASLYCKRDRIQLLTIASELEAQEPDPLKP